MKKIVILLALLSVLAIASSMVVRGNETESKTTMLSHLKAGQQVELYRGEADTFTITIIDERVKKPVKAFENERVIKCKILEIGVDYIVVSSPNDLEETIAASAIHVIWTYPNEQSAKGADGKK